MNKPVKMEPGVKLRDAEKMALIPVKVLPTEKKRNVTQARVAKNSLT